MKIHIEKNILKLVIREKKPRAPYNCDHIATIAVKCRSSVLIDMSERFTI